MVKRSLLLLSIIVAINLYSEVDLDASLSGIILSVADKDGNNLTSAVGKGQVVIKSSGNSNVKSQVALDMTTTVAGVQLDLSKAWVKFRYPGFRGMIGKNRVSWGEGAAFNAGDVIFDDFKVSGNPLTGNSSSDDFDMTADELKSANRIMATINLPLGRFTFVEGIYMPYNFSTDFIMATQALSIINPIPGTISDTIKPEVLQEEAKGKEFKHHSFGGRFRTKLLGTKVEAGYLYNGFDEIHKPYLSLSGTAHVDYHISSSINVVHGDTEFNSWKESLKISVGAFYLFDLEEERTLTLRLESLIKPFGIWEEDSSKKSDYGITFYPEVAFVLNEEISLFLRGLVSPLDVSCKATLGLNWKTYQGFNIGFFTIANLGEEGDLFSMEGSDFLTLMVNVSHKF